MFQKLVSRIKTYKVEQYLLNEFKGRSAALQRTIHAMPSFAEKIRFNLKDVKQNLNIYLKSIKLRSAFSLASATIGVRGAGAFFRAHQRKMLALVLGAGITSYSLNHFAPEKTKIVLHYEKTLENLIDVSRLSYLNDSHFYPSFFLTHSLAQSIFNVGTRYMNIKYHRDYVKLEDGGQVCIDWASPMKQVEYSGNPHENKYYPYESTGDNKIMFIIHGLTGGSDTQYIQYLVRYAQKHHYRVAVFNHRGINQPLLTPTPTHGGNLTDIEAAIDFARKKYPNAPMVAVGTSMGGNQLLRYLGSKGKDTPFVAAAAIAAPFDLDLCTDAVENTVYEKFFVRKYIEQTIIPNFDMLKNLEKSHGVDLNGILKTEKLREFHSNLSLKVFTQHKDLKDFFGSTRITDEDINNISIPLMCLQAKDDPIVVRKGIPLEKIVKNKNIIFAETSHGAHICWFSGLKPTRWYPKPTIQYLDLKLEGLGNQH